MSQARYREMLDADFADVSSGSSHVKYSASGRGTCRSVFVADLSQVVECK